MNLSKMAYQIKVITLHMMTMIRMISIQTKTIFMTRKLIWMSKKRMMMMMMTHKIGNKMMKMNHMRRKKQMMRISKRMVMMI